MPDRASMLKNWRTLTITAGLSWLMKLLMMILLPVAAVKGEYLFIVLIIFSIAVSLIPSLLERSYRVTLPFEMDLLITLSIFANTFMGEWLDFYEKIWLYDKLLHMYSSGVVGLLAFIVVYTLNYTGKVRLSLPFIGVFTVTFAMAMGGMWEIGEFTVDSLFGKNTQKGLGDTMWDLINDLIGGAVVAALGMAYVRYANPDERKRLAKPLGEVFGAGKRIDRLRARMKKAGPGAEPPDREAQGTE
ncbi:MAG: hypothetical protein H3C68_04160 [Deltaproteobacteria bacterium]|nr:hypothetical protein [Deltaproteobacteria bacterium]MBZ0219919.1 hypothetical protein [Deltaproteobacteria bacterium]